MWWLLFLNAGLSFWAVNALGTRIIEAQNRIKESYNIKPKGKKVIKEIFEAFINAVLLFTPGVNIAALIFSCFSDEKDFDDFVKRGMSKNNILEDKKTGKIFEPKKSKFSIKNIFKNIKAKKTVEPKKEEKKSEPIKEEPKPKEDKPNNSEKLINELNEKLDETPKEESKPFVRTALQPEGQLPFEIVWENDHVYSGTIRSLKR